MFRCEITDVGNSLAWLPNSCYYIHKTNNGVQGVTQGKLHSTPVTRAVKNVVSTGRLTMNSSQLWNLHQRHKFLRAEASRDILKIRVSEMVFPGVFRRMPCCLVRIPGLLIGRRKKVKFLRIFRDKLAEKSGDFVGIFGVNFADKQSIKYGCFCGNFLGKFC